MTTDAVDYEIVEAIHNVGRVMGIKTVAESVENADILAALVLVGVDFAQGFHISRPMPTMDITYQARQEPLLVATAAASGSAAIAINVGEPSRASRSSSGARRAGLVDRRYGAAPPLRSFLAKSSSLSANGGAFTGHVERTAEELQ